MRFVSQSTLLICALLSMQAIAQDTGRNTLEGSWEGPLVLGRDNWTMAFTFTSSGDDYAATLTSGGMGIYGMPVDSVSLDGRRIVIRISRLDLEFTGTIRRDESGEKIVRIDGDWFQYSEMVPVVLQPVDSPTF